MSMNKEELYMEDTINNINDENEKYVLTEWGCLYLTLLDYGIDASHIPSKVGKHIVEDFMEMMEQAGYVKRGKENV